MRFLKSTLLVLAVFTTNAHADGFDISLGADYSTGKYGTNSSTNVAYVPFRVNYQTGAFRFNVVVPYIRVNGNGDVVPSGISGSGTGTSGAVSNTVCTTTPDNNGQVSGGNKVEDNITTCTTTVTPGATTTTATTKQKRSTESGLGDIVASATYNVWNGGDQGFDVDVSGRIKFATADEDKGLGSGENDYAIQTNIDKNFGPAYASFGLGYRHLGEPRGVDFRGVVYGSLGGGYRFTRDTEAGISYDWATAAVKNATKPQSIAVYASHYINDNYKLSGELYTGLSNASSDVGGGVTLGYYF